MPKKKGRLAPREDRRTRLLLRVPQPGEGKRPGKEGSTQLGRNHPIGLEERKRGCLGDMAKKKKKPWHRIGGALPQEMKAD